MANQSQFGPPSWKNPFDLDDDFWDWFSESSKNWGDAYDQEYKDNTARYSPEMRRGAQKSFANMNQMTAQMTPPNPMASWTSPFAPSNYGGLISTPLEGYRRRS
tara:strand:- start:332 stop:643 length:312 start_codon:yes stop_codon:yes gene_type:complete